MSDARKGWLTISTLAVLTGCMFVAAHRFSAYEQAAYAQSRMPRPYVIAVRPGDGDVTVLPDSSIAVDLLFPDSIETRVSGLDPASLSSESVRLLDELGERVESRLNTSGAGDAIVLVPVNPLVEGRRYNFQITPKLRDLNGRAFVPFSSSFIVTRDVARESIDVAFEQIKLNVEPGTAFTAITIGPDRKLYAGTFDGQIIRYTIQGDGTLIDAQIIDTIQKHNDSPRMVIGFAFDPNSPGEKLWVSHGQLKPFEGGSITGADDWTGKISIIEGKNLEHYRDAVIHLPRGFKDHLNFQPTFGPDGALYFNQGSHTSSGAPDSKWGMRPERLMTAAILRLDVNKIANQPIDAQTEGTGAYDPRAQNAPLTIYATGVRSAYDLLWHSSNKLFASVNGYASGGNAPARPQSNEQSALNSIERLSQTSDDMLIDIHAGAYYGHPNPLRNEFIINGGNPTRLVDPYEVVEYPIGTMPESNWHMPVMSFGKNVSPNGMIEYKSDAFSGKLKNYILVTRFSSGDDIVAIELDEHGAPRSLVTGISGFGGLTDPLDLAHDAKTGRIYVAEFGGQRLTLLRPVAGTSQIHRRKAR